MMQIKANTLKTFLQKVNLDRTIEEPVIRCTDDGLLAINTDPTDIFFNKVTLHKSAFKQFEKIESFGLFNLSRFIDLINSFGDEVINVDFQENFIKVAGKDREGEFVVPDLEIFEDKLKLEEPEIPHDAEIKVPREYLVRVSAAINIVNAKFVTFETNANLLSCEAGDQDTIKEKRWMKNEIF